MAKFKKTLAAFAMPAVALIAAAVTCFFVPFDKQYLDYFDFRTLACLFCTLAVVCAFKNIRFFRWLADVIVRRFKTVRGAVIALVFVTYFGSMIMANDMALITFLPLGFLVLESCAQRKYLAFVFVMQNVAANLGGMLTPFGNQFFVSCNPDGGFAVDFAAAVNAFTPPCCVKIAGKMRL